MRFAPERTRILPAPRYVVAFPTSRTRLLPGRGSPPTLLRLLLLEPLHPAPQVGHPGLELVDVFAS